MDLGEGVFPRALSLVPEKFGRKAMSNDCSRCVQSMCEEVPLVGLESTAENKLESMVCKGEPLSTSVKMGGRSALGLSTSPALMPPLTRRSSARCSLLRLLLAPSCTLMQYSFFLSVV
jgi:hypothetical protein